MGLGLIAAKTMSESLAFRPKSVWEYAIENNLLGAHGWSRVCILAQKTSDDKMLEKIKRRVGQIENSHKIRMTPKSQAGPEGAVPCSPKEGGSNVDGRRRRALYQIYQTFHMVEMVMSENRSLAGCDSVSFPKTSPIQTAEGGFVDASNCYYSLKTENETPEKVWKARTAMCHAPGGIRTHDKHTSVCL
jgi:hypothetical protein